MKKKIFGLLCGGIMAFSLFASPGNVAQAEETEPCDCHSMLPLTGAERNKIVANFLSSEAYKTKKLELLAKGYNWNGAHTIQVIVPGEGITMVGVPYFDANGVLEVNVFFNGMWVGTSPEL